MAAELGELLGLSTEHLLTKELEKIEEAEKAFHFKPPLFSVRGPKSGTALPK